MLLLVPLSLQKLSFVLDLELTIDPAPPPPGGIFETMIFLNLIVCSIPYLRVLLPGIFEREEETVK